MHHGWLMANQLMVTSLVVYVSVISMFKVYYLSMVTNQQMFSNDIAEAILHTPLYDHVIHDRLIWKAESNGCYTVWSTYRLCVEELIDVSHLRHPANWQNIWCLKVPPKVKNLLWRMRRGCLPTRVCL
jgi:hypothetical protein